MKTHNIILIGICLLWSSSVQAGDLCSSSERGAMPKSIRSLRGDDDLDKETDRFLKAKEYVFKREWKKAKSRLEAYLKTYPSGHYRDEALFWLAKSLDKLSREKKSLDQLLKLKEEALRNLDLLLCDHVESLWIDDAQVLKQELAGQLALLGTEEHQRYLDEMVASQDVNEADVEIIALNSLKDLESEIAIPLLKKILKTEKDPVVRKKSIVLFGWEYPEKTFEILKGVAGTDPDVSVREEAAYLVDQIEMERIPVQLNYFCFGAKFKDSKDYHLLPENRLKMFNLPRSKSKSQKSVQKAIKRFFDDKLTDLKSMAMSFGNYGLRLGRPISIDSSQISHINKALEYYVWQNVAMKIDDNIKLNLGKPLKYLKYLNYGIPYISHRVYGFNIMNLGEGFKKEYDQISGNLLFLDIDSDKEYKVSYTVDDRFDKLIAIRKGDKVAMMVLQFESEEEEPDEEPVYSTKFMDVLGCIVHSTRQSWSSGEMSKVHEVMDFGEAKAEIRSEGGKWILEGNIISDGKTRRFIGRNAVLYDPKRKMVAEAAQIIVPVEHPEKYEVKGKKEK